ALEHLADGAGLAVDGFHAAMLSCVAWSGCTAPRTSIWPVTAAVMRAERRSRSSSIEPVRNFVCEA
ncbi:MAG TPA: hypothetical protein PLL39_18255, partial [Rhodocyclaceae bacterium]|nr:hypothetical protein [Rhodocyclaceae bacterium]